MPDQHIIRIVQWGQQGTWVSLWLGKRLYLQAAYVAHTDALAVERYIRYNYGSQWTLEY